MDMHKRISQLNRDLYTLQAQLEESRRSETQMKMALQSEREQKRELESKMRLLAQELAGKIQKRNQSVSVG